MKLLSCMALLICVSASAQTQNECPEIQLDQKDSTIQGIPIWNQGATPSCYLYSSSFMASAWVRKHWPESKDFVVDPAQAFSQLMSSSTEIKEPILDAENGRTCMSLRWLLKGIAGNIRNGIELKQPECRMFGLDKVRDHQILKRPIEFKERMKELIAKRELFSIEYCSAVLTGSGKDFIKDRVFDSTLTYLNSPDQYKNFEAGCGFHVSVVVGQAMREGRCHARIRNSWGTSNGEKGYNWVDMDELSKNTLRVVTFE